MANTPRSLIHELARSQKIQKAVHEIGVEIGKEAAKIDTSADIVVDDVLLTVDGMERVATTVTNQSPDSTVHEFGGAKQQAFRPIGRAVDRVAKVSRVS